jgi:hypothetical protein
MTERLSPRLRRVLFALALAGLAFARVIPSGGVVGRPEGELRDHLWVAWGVARSTAAGAWPFHADWAGVPDGVPLYPLDPLHQLFVSALTPVLGTVGATNLLSFGLFVLLVYGGQKIAARQEAGLAAELLCGLLVATAPPMLGPFADTQTEGMATGCLLLLLSELLAPGPRAGRAGLWAALLVLGSPYQAHAIALFAAVAWLWRRLPLRALALPFVAATLAAALLVSTESSPGGVLDVRETQLARATAPPRSSPLGVAPPPPLPADGVARATAAYPGAAETGPRREAAWMYGGMLLIALRWRPARLPAALALAYAAVAAGNRFGPLGAPADFLTPYELFWRTYPLAAYAWKPGQYAVPALGLLVVAFAAAWREAGPRARAGLGALALGAALEAQVRSSPPPPLPASTLHPRAAWLALAAEPDDGAVVEYPCRARGVPGRPPVADVLLGPLWHARPLGETLNRGTAPAHARLLDALEGAAVGRGGDLPTALARAEAEGFRHILLLGAQLPPDAVARLAAALTAAGHAPEPPDADGTVRVDLADRSPQ